MNLLLLYAEFFKMGLFAVGGGLATLPFLFQMADKYDWLSREMAGNFLAVAQAVPGPVGVNMAAQAGFQCAGIAGALLAALGLVSPAIAIISLIARMFRSFKDNRIVASVFAGFRPAAVGLLAAAGMGVWKLALYRPAPVWHEALRWKEALLFILVFAGITRLKGHPILWIAIAGIVGIVCKL